MDPSGWKPLIPEFSLYASEIFLNSVRKVRLTAQDQDKAAVSMLLPGLEQSHVTARVRCSYTFSVQGILNWQGGLIELLKD